MIPPASIRKQVQPYLSRAKELAIADPIISYFCKLYSAQLILDQRLHQNDAAVAEFVTFLLDDIEQMKLNASEEMSETIEHEEKGLEYAKNFAFSVLENCRKQIDEDKVTKKTPLELIASVNFLTLIKLWEPSDEVKKEVTERIKYAKFHAARLLKEAKQPKKEPKEQSVSDELSAPTKESIKGEDDRLEPISQNLEPKASHTSSLPSLSQFEKELEADVSVTPPLSPVGLIERASPLNRIPSPIDISFDELSRRNSSSPLKSRSVSPVKKSRSASPVKQSRSASPVKKISPPPIIKHVQAQRSPVQEKVYLKDEISMIMEETEVFSKAQKHAKYAISALNYEDKVTAIAELKRALDLLEA